MSNSWDKYFQSTQALKPSKYLVEALKTHSPLGGKALDLGCGAGRDSRYLLEKGFYVTTVDAAQDAAKYISQLPHQEKLQFICSKFEDFDFGYDNYDLINAHYALPFVNPANFEVVFQKVTTSLKSHGLFVGQLFGIEDEWHGKRPELTFHTREDVEMLFSDFENLVVHETNETGSTADKNQKHWHVFNITAIK